MKLSSLAVRLIIHLVLAAGFAVSALAAMADAAIADAKYPNKPITLILPWPAQGTSTDRITRKIAEEMQSTLGQSFEVKNRSGDSGVIGTNEMIRSRADGYTVGTVTVGPAVSQIIAGNTPYEMADLKPVGMFGTLPFIIAARADAPFDDIKSLAEWSTITGLLPVVAHWGKASVPTLYAYLIAEQADFTFIEQTHFRVDGSVLLKNQADLAIVPMNVVAAGLKNGTLKAIVALTPQRLSQLPELATVKEQGFDFDAAIWAGLFAPKTTPDQVIEVLHDALGKALATESVQAFAAELGMTIHPTTPAEAAAQMKKEYASFQHIMKQLGLLKN